jgi:hypothetical protein
MRKVCCTLALLWASLVAGQVAAQEPDLKEPSTGLHFATDAQYAGTPFRCLAVGVRRKLIFDVYGIAFCMERGRAEGVLREAATQGQGRTEAFFTALREAPVAKAAHLVFVRDVGRAAAADALVQAVKAAVGPERAAELGAMVARDVKAGEELVVTTRPDGMVHVVTGGEDRSLVDPTIAKQVWNVWLSEGGVSPSLREALARRAGQTAN